MMLLLVLSLLIPLVQGTILSIATQNPNSEPPLFEIDTVDPLTGKFTKIVDLPPDGIPANCVALRNDNTLVYCTEFNASSKTGGSCLTTVDLSTKQIQQGQRYTNFWFVDLGFDKVTNQTFTLGFNGSTNDYHVYEVLPNQTLRDMVLVPRPQFVGAGTYSSSKHIFFLNMDLLVAVGTVGEQAGKILYAVDVSSVIVENLVYDDTFGMLYAWAYDYANRATLLVSLDYTTGKLTNTFYTSITQHFGLPVCVDKTGYAIYTFLVDQPGNRSVILDLSGLKASKAPADRFALTMSCQ